MTDINGGWGAPPRARFDSLAETFRPVFARIGKRAVDRDLARELPFDAYGWLKTSGFSRLRLPPAQGGFGATLPELFGLIIELAAADPNLETGG